MKGFTPSLCSIANPSLRTFQSIFFPCILGALFHNFPLQEENNDTEITNPKLLKDKQYKTSLLRFFLYLGILTSNKSLFLDPFFKVHNMVSISNNEIAFPTFTLSNTNL